MWGKYNPLNTAAEGVKNEFQVFGINRCWRGCGRIENLKK